MINICAGRYAVDKKGNLYSWMNTQGNRRRAARLLKPAISRAGYLFTVITEYSTGEARRKGVHIHRLVAEAYLANPLGKPYVNHKDGNKVNNEVTNLEWVTPSENDLHAYRTGLRLPHPNCKGRFNESHPKSQPIRQLTMTGEVVQVFPSAHEAQRQGFSQSNISLVISGKRHSHKGYRWELV